MLSEKKVCSLIYVYPNGSFNVEKTQNKEEWLEQFKRFYNKPIRDKKGVFPKGGVPIQDIAWAIDSSERYATTLVEKNQLEFKLIKGVIREAKFGDLCSDCQNLCRIDPYYAECLPKHSQQGFSCGCELCKCKNNVHCQKRVKITSGELSREENKPKSNHSNYPLLVKPESNSLRDKKGGTAGC